MTTASPPSPDPSPPPPTPRGARVVTDPAGQRWVQTADVPEVGKHSLKTLRVLCADVAYFEHRGRPVRWMPVDALAAVLVQRGVPAPEATARQTLLQEAPLLATGVPRRAPQKLEAAALAGEVPVPGLTSPAPAEPAVELVTAESPPPPALAPIAMNGAGAAIELGGRSIAVHDLGGRGCVLASDLGRLLGYGDDGRDLADRITKDWAGEFLPGRDFEVVVGAPLRAFKQTLGLRAPGALGRRARACIVLFERGVDLVSTKTDKPLGASLRAYLVDEVLPKLRRGEAVVPASAPAPGALPTPGLDEERLARIMATAMATAIVQIIPAAIEGAVRVLRPLLLFAAPPAPQPEMSAPAPTVIETPPPPAPVAVAPVVASEPAPLPPIHVPPNVVPAADDFLSATRMAARLTVALQRPVSAYAVGRAASALGFRENADLYQIKLGKRTRAEGEAACYHWLGVTWAPFLTYFRAKTAPSPRRGAKPAPGQTPLPLAGAH